MIIFFDISAPVPSSKLLAFLSCHWNLEPKARPTHNYADDGDDNDGDDDSNWIILRASVENNLPARIIAMTSITHSRASFPIRGSQVKWRALNA